MASSFKRLEISPDLLDLGTVLVRLDKIASVSRTERHPLRLVGILLLLIALALVGFEAMFNLAAFSVKSKGSLKIWAACGAAGIGVFCLVYAQRCLVVQLAGGSNILLKIASQSFADELVDVLRRALSLRPGTPFHAVADLTAEKLTETEPEAMLGPHHDSAPDGHHGHGGLPHQRPAHVAPGHFPGAGPSHFPANGAAGWQQPHGGSAIEPHRQAMSGDFSPAAHGRQVGPVLNGHGAAPPPGPGMAPRAGPAPSLGPQIAATRSAPPFNGAPGGPHGAPAAVHAGQPPTFAATSLNGRPGSPQGNRDLAQLIDFVGRSDIQHKETLLELLRVVEDHEIGGRTSRDDALAHWKSFSDYVVQYLTGVDGLPLLTAQAARSLTRIG